MAYKIGGTVGRPVNDFRAFGYGFPAFSAGARESACHYFWIVFHFVFWVIVYDSGKG